MARFTARGAPAGAAACPQRRRASVPGTVGPEAGKMFAFADDTIAAKTAAPTRILGLRGYTTVFGACLMPQELALPREKSTWARFVKTFSRGLLGRCCGMLYALKISSAGHNYPASGKEYAATRFPRSALNPGRNLFPSAATVAPVLAVAPANQTTNALLRGVRLSRSTWTNIVFVAIASVGGLVCAFYFFNGSELL